MQRRLCAAILSLEAIAFGLSTPVLISVADLSHGDRSVDRAGAEHRLHRGRRAAALRLGLLAGLGIQVAAIAVGVVAHSMIVVGTVFLALWATAWFLGRKIEIERAEWTARGEFPGQAAAGSADQSHLVWRPCLSAPWSCSSPTPSAVDSSATSCPGSRPRA